MTSRIPSRPTTPIATARIAVLVTAVALGLAGCGDTPSDDARGSTGAPTAAATGGGADGGPVAGVTTADPADAERAAGSEGADLLSGTVPTVDGGTLDLSTLVGRPAALWFWAPWCPICHARAPGIGDVAAEYGDRLNLVGVAGLSSDGAAMAEFVDGTGIGGFPNIADTTGEVYTRMGVQAQDAWILVAADGTVTRVFGQGPNDLRDKLDALLG